MLSKDNQLFLSLKVYPLSTFCTLDSRPKPRAVHPRPDLPCTVFFFRRLRVTDYV